MSYVISLSGNKEEAKKAAVEQSDRSIEQGHQTQEQKALAVALIDALPGTHVSGTVSGHNGDGTVSGHNGDGSGWISISVSSSTPTE